MVVSKHPRKSQVSIVRVAVASAMCFIIYALNEERTRLAKSVALSTSNVAETSSTKLSTEDTTSIKLSTDDTTSIKISTEDTTSASAFVPPIQSLSSQVRTFDTATVADAYPPCLPFVFYDKPVKTGSTAVTEALSKYIEKVDEPENVCLTMESCSAMAMDTCNGQIPRAHLIQHVNVTSPVTGCLREKGYYHVTSIREPKERVISAWKYSLSKKESHYGIPWNATIEDFLKAFPKCALYYYYDRKKHVCGSKEEVTARAEEIVSRMDEVIDLDQDAITDVHRRIYPYISKVNVASSGRSKSSELQVPDEVVEYEYILYNMLKEKRLSLAQNPRRRLCQKGER